MKAIVATFVSVIVLVALSVPVSAQEEEVFERPFGPPLKGYTTGSGVIVLDDEDYCSYVFGSVWGTGKDISTLLIDFYGWNKKQVKRAVKEFASNPTTDEFALAGCVQALNQFNLPPRDPIPMPDWSLDHPVIPEALAPLLTGEALTLSTPTPDPPPAAGDAVVVTGKGEISGSKPFTLDGGDYEVTLDTKGDCDLSGWYLKRTEDGRGVESFEQSGYVYAVDAGRHFIKVIASDKCQWTTTITPLAE
jgi:hypothetical protein